MKINIASVLRNENSSLKVVFNEELTGFKGEEGDVQSDGSAKFAGAVENDKGLIILKGTLEIGYRAQCGRCLKEVEGTMTLDISEELQNSEEVDDGYTLTYTSEELDLEQILFSYGQLNMPMKILCSEDCKGICAVCGTDLNEEDCQCREEYDINPQMEKLKGFFLRNE